jgi:hypothetical protein
VNGERNPLSITLQNLGKKNYTLVSASASYHDPNNHWALVSLLRSHDHIFHVLIVRSGTPPRSSTMYHSLAVPTSLPHSLCRASKLVETNPHRTLAYRQVPSPRARSYRLGQPRRTRIQGTTPRHSLQPDRPHHSPSWKSVLRLQPIL